MFLIGAVPALLALVIRRRLKEPERWQQASHEGAAAKKARLVRELFSHPVWRKHALLGLAAGLLGRHRPVGGRFLHARLDPAGANEAADAIGL